MSDNAEENARKANDPDLWNKLWRAEGEDSWRGKALRHVYDRISKLIPARSSVVDLGGGIGILAKRLRDDKQIECTVIDASDYAVDECRSAGFVAFKQDLETTRFEFKDNDHIVATEVMEHLSEAARDRIFAAARATGKLAIFSVPNDRLGPEEEPQHTVKYTALSFLEHLRRHWGPACRVEVMGPYLLGICGVGKSATLSVTLPIRDESADIEAVLASFRGVADEIVVGIDPRTVDNSAEICRKYAETVFFLDELRGPPGEEVPEGGIHFAHARNQCIDRCKSEWIFMTEGHERLLSGQDTLLQIGDLIPKPARVGMVLRTGNGQQWGFPWLFRKDPSIRFKRSTHNVLDFPEKTYVVQLPQVKTLHDRVHERELARKDQRKIQNRIELTHDWMVNGNENSLYYLGSEWREYDEERAIKYLSEFIITCRNNGPMRYQTRLILAKTLNRKGEPAEARKVLLEAVGDDWVRTDHWIWLGDLAFNSGKLEEALQFYLYGATRIGNPPFTMWWIDLSFYSYIPAERLAMVYSALGRYEDALFWSKRVLELFPSDAPQEMVEEAISNQKLIEEALHGSRR